MGVGHDWAEENADLTGVKGLIKVDTIHISPDRGMAIYYLRTTDQAKAVGNVGIHLMKFCSKHDLVRIRDNVKFYAEPFNARFYQDQAVAG